MSVCTAIYMQKCTLPSAESPTHLHPHTSTPAHTHAHPHPQTRTPTHAHANTPPHTSTHTRTHKNRHTHTRAHTGPWPRRVLRRVQRRGWKRCVILCRGFRLEEARASNSRRGRITVRPGSASELTRLVGVTVSFSPTPCTYVFAVYVYLVHGYLSARTSEGVDAISRGGDLSSTRSGLVAGF